MSAPTEPTPGVPIIQKREFWVLMGYAVALGVFGAFAGLVFMGVTEANGTIIANTVLRFTVVVVFLVVWRAARPHHT